jgi:hypothetical protein
VLRMAASPWAGPATVGMLQARPLGHCGRAPGRPISVPSQAIVPLSAHSANLN